MRQLLLVSALAAALCGPAAAQSPDVEKLAAAVDAKVLAWRRDIHQHPELGNREVRTSKLVADHLKALGFEDVRTGIATTGVTAVLRGGKPGPRIALRADMDALPVTERSGLPFFNVKVAVALVLHPGLAQVRLLIAPTLPSALAAFADPLRHLPRPLAVVRGGRPVSCRHES